MYFHQHHIQRDRHATISHEYENITQSSCSESFTPARSRKRSAFINCQVHSSRKIRIYNQREI